MGASTVTVLGWLVLATACSNRSSAPPAGGPPPGTTELSLSTVALRAGDVVAKLGPSVSVFKVLRLDGSTVQVRVYGGEYDSAEQALAALRAGTLRVLTARTAMDAATLAGLRRVLLGNEPVTAEELASIPPPTNPR